MRYRAAWVLPINRPPIAGGTVTVDRDVITADQLAAHIKVLASDEFQGRAPASPGEDKTMKYLTDQFVPQHNATFARAPRDPRVPSSRWAQPISTAFYATKKSESWPATTR